MTDQPKTLQIEQEETAAVEKTERLRDRRISTSRTDIYETADSIVLVMDVPGVDQNSVEVILEKSVLTIRAYPAYPRFEGYTLAYSEYDAVDYQRSFTLSDEIDRSRIDASVKNGILTLTLAKAGETQPHKIGVRGG